MQTVIPAILTSDTEDLRAKLQLLLGSKIFDAQDPKEAFRRLNEMVE